jgi:hypothetical protein
MSKVMKWLYAATVLAGLVSIAITIGEIATVRHLIGDVQKASADMDAVADWLAR